MITFMILKDKEYKFRGIFQEIKYRYKYIKVGGLEFFAGFS